MEYKVIGIERHGSIITRYKLKSLSNGDIADGWFKGWDKIRGKNIKKMKLAFADMTYPSIVVIKIEDDNKTSVIENSIWTKSIWKQDQ